MSPNTKDVPSHAALCEWCRGPATANGVETCMLAAGHESRGIRHAFQLREVTACGIEDLRLQLLASANARERLQTEINEATAALDGELAHVDLVYPTAIIEACGAFAASAKLLPEWVLDANGVITLPGAVRKLIESGDEARAKLESLRSYVGDVMVAMQELHELQQGWEGEPEDHALMDQGKQAWAAMVAVLMGSGHAATSAASDLLKAPVLGTIRPPKLAAAAGEPLQKPAVSPPDVGATVEVVPEIVGCPWMLAKVNKHVQMLNAALGPGEMAFEVDERGGLFPMSDHLFTWRLPGEGER